MTSSTSHANSVRVVLFEDNDALREVLFQLISDADGLCCVGAFPDAQNIMERLNESRPDVILMDIDLPGMNGIDSTLLIKREFPSLPVLILTVFEDDVKIFNAICAGAKGYLLKNSKPEKIIESILEIRQGGSPMSPMVARKVLETFKSNTSEQSGKKYELSMRELEILDHLTKGLSYKMIADKCSISIDTVKFHAKNIYEKLQVHSKSEAVIVAIRNKIV